MSARLGSVALRRSGSVSAANSAPASQRAQGSLMGDEGSANARRLTTAELAELKQTFEMFDTDGSGSIDVAEIGGVFRRLGMNPSEDEVRNMIREIDVNGDGEIDLQEFTHMMETHAQHLNTDDGMHEAFKIFDKDGTGYISAAELLHVLKALGLPVSDEELEEMMKEADSDGDGQIGFEEFRHVMMLP